MTMATTDSVALLAGAGAWAAVIPLVKYAGEVCELGGTNTKIAFLGFGVLVAGVTTPLLSYILGWKTREARIRGIALALGMAQTLDGFVHVLYPSFYSSNPSFALASAGNIFWGAGLLGILSVYT
jgi:hypothetical protein